MCIICNVASAGSSNNDMVADRFLTAFDRSRKAMEQAAAAMLAVSQLDISPEHKRRYDRTHKQMRRVMREWNAIEQMREATPTRAPKSPA